MSFYDDYKKYLLDEIINGEIKLLGQIKCEESEYEYLVSYGNVIVAHLKNLANPKPDLLLAFLMVQIAINCYQDGNYWKYFEEELDTQLNGAKQNYLGKLFVKTIEFYNLLKLEKQNDQEQYVENIKAHAFVTNNYMAGFFEFATAFHENNLLRDLPPSSDDMLDAVESLSDYMKESLNSNSDSIKSGSAKAAKSYKLLKSTRKVFAQCDSVTVSSIFYPVLKTIDLDIFDQILPSGQNRFDSAYVDWRNNQDKQSNESISSRERLRRSSYGKKPYLQIDPNTEETVLVIPAQSFRKTDCEEGASIGIRIDGEVCVYDLELRDSFGMYISEPIKLSVSNVFEEIDIRFIKAGSKSFKIKKRDYRILSEQWKTLDKLALGINLILVKKGVDVYWNDHCELIEETDEFVNWDLYSVRINADSACKIGDNSLSIAGEYSKKPIFDNQIEEFEILDEDRNRIIATRTHPIISFEVEESIINGTIIDINNKSFPIREIPEEYRPVFYENNKAAISIDINNVLPSEEEGCYSIDLDIPTAGRSRICDYVLLRKISCNFNSKFYVFKENAYLHFSSTLHEISGDPDWIIEESGYNRTVFKIPIDPDLEFVDLDFYLNGKSDRILYLRKPINVFSYGFTAEQKIYLRNRNSYVWHTELTDNLYVRMKDTEEVYAFYEKDEYTLYRAELISPGVFRIDISEIVQVIKNNYDAMRHHIKLIFDATSGESLTLSDILLKNLIYPNPMMNIKAKEEGVYIPIEEIKGRAESLMTVTDSETKEPIISERVLFEGDNFFPELEYDKPYDFTLMSREGDEFGLFSDTKVVRSVSNYIIKDPSNLVGYSVKIESVEYDGEQLALNQQYRIRVVQQLREKIYLGLLDGCALDEEGRINRTETNYLKDVLLAVIEDKEESVAALVGRYDGKEQPLFYDAVKGVLLKGNNTAATESLDKKRYLKLQFEKMRVTYFKSKLKELRSKTSNDKVKQFELKEDYSTDPILDEIQAFEVYDGDRKIHAVRTHPIITFETEEQESRGISIVINGEENPIEECTSIVQHMVSKEKTHVYRVNIGDLLENQEDGYYSVCISIPDSEIKCVCKYVLLKHIKVYLDRSAYIFQETAQLKINNAEQCIETDSTWVKEGDTEGGVSYRVPLDPRMEYIEMGLLLKGNSEKSLKIRKPINIFSYGFSPDERIFLRNKDDYIWYTDLSNTMYVRNNATDEVTVSYDDEEEPMAFKGIESKKGIFEINITQLKKRIEKNKEKGIHRIRLHFGDSTDKYLMLNEILSCNKIIPFPMASMERNNDKLLFHVDRIVGKAWSVIRVRDHYTGKLIKDVVLDVGENVVDELSIHDKYDITLLSAERNGTSGISLKTIAIRKNVRLNDI